MTRLRKGDQVIVMAGADRGQTGRILSLDRKTDKVIVEGVNMKWKHVRRSQENPQGGRERREYPFNVSNVFFLDSETGKGTRLGVVVEDGKKQRVARPSGRKVD